MQLTGRGKTPEEREKILRKLSGIKEQPKKKEKEKKTKAAEKAHAAMAMGSAAREKHAAAKEESTQAGKAAPDAKAGRHKIHRRRRGAAKHDAHAHAGAGNAAAKRRVTAESK